MTTDLSPMAAVTDILWLQKRFQGILDLAAKLEDVAALESYADELAVSTQTLKAENATLLGVKLDLETAVADAKATAESVIAEANAQAAQIIEAAKNEAEVNRADARANLSNEIMTMAIQKEQKTKEVADLQAASDKLALDIVAQQDSLAKLQKAIDDLKARF